MATSPADPQPLPSSSSSSSSDSTRPIAVIDIDGVVADVRHRLHHLQQRPPDWFGFFDAADADPPLAVGVERALALAEDHDIVWLTGRPEWLRDVTARWLAEQGLPTEVLLMRGNSDRRPARVLKASVLHALAAGRAIPGADASGQRRIAIVIDDDSAVVARLRTDGWPVEQADWVGLTSTGAARLATAQEAEGRT